MHLATSPDIRHRYSVGMNRSGFTLIELLIVVAIIGLVATIAVPKLINTKERALVASMKSDLRKLVTAEESYLGDQFKYTADLGPDYHYSASNRPSTITLTGEGWPAIWSRTLSASRLQRHSISRNSDACSYSVCDVRPRRANGDTSSAGVRNPRRPSLPAARSASGSGPAVGGTWSKNPPHSSKLMNSTVRAHAGLCVTAA